MRIKRHLTSFMTGHIAVTTEHEEDHELIVKGQDGHGHYAVEWDAGEKWMAGEFCDDGELYECDGDETFSCEDGAELVSVKGQDGGFSWNCCHAP